MQLRTLGQSPLQVSPLCLGGNVFGWTADEKTSFSLLDAWVDAGFNFIDTADTYSIWAPGHAGGESETVIGKWLRQSGRRDKVVIATKVGMDMGEGRVGLKPARIREAVEQSLRRLQVDCIDLYQAHKDDEDTPLEETLEAFGALIKQGKVRAIGASNYPAARVRAALDVSAQKRLARYEVLQPEYNLYDREGFEKELAPLAVGQQLGVICYFSLASGFLTGKYRTVDDLAGSSRADFLGKYFDERGTRILAALRELAVTLSTTPAQLSLAWLMARPGVTAPIASATKPEQLDDILGAADLQLPAEAMAQLDRASA